MQQCCTAAAYSRCICIKLHHSSTLPGRLHAHAPGHRQSCTIPRHTQIGIWTPAQIWLQVAAWQAQPQNICTTGCTSNPSVHGCCRRPSHWISVELVHPSVPIIAPCCHVVARYQPLPGAHWVAADDAGVPALLATMAGQVGLKGVNPTVLTLDCAKCLLHCLVHGHLQHKVPSLRHSSRPQPEWRSTCKGKREIPFEQDFPSSGRLTCRVCFENTLPLSS